MDYEQIKYEVETSPTLKLVKSPNAAFVVSFLHKQFKVAHRVSVAQLELEEKLEDYLTVFAGKLSGAGVEGG